MNIKSAKVLVVDYDGVCLETAVRFMRDCSSVKYCTIKKSDFLCKVGKGIDGIDRIDDFWNHIDGVDFIFCPDIGSSEIVEFLKGHDYPCAGSGSIEKLENDRWWGRNLQKDRGLPVQKSCFIEGVSALKEFCRKNKNYYVKVDTEYREISKSFKHYDFKSSEPRIDFIAFKTGPFKEEVGFVCEEILEGIEPGFDGITFDGNILYPTTAGYEVNKKNHIVRVYQNEQELPDVYKCIHNGLSDEFRKRKTRFFYSSEFIVSKDRLPYLLDPCMRMASPGGVSIHTELIDNFTEVCYGLAIGVSVNPIIKYKYGLASPLFSSETKNNFTEISFPKEMRRWVKLFQACKKGDSYYVVPSDQDPTVACVVALGDTVKDTVELCQKRVKEVKGNGLSSDEDEFSKMIDLINKGKALGISF